MAQDYNKTLNLVQTDFNMRAALPQREPAMVAKWQENDLYHKMVKNNEGKPKYVLHDGPPYANGDIHLGTALNKVLKDFIVRQKNMSGYQAPYVPGWDTHGLPIELKARKKAGVSNNISPVDLRKICADYALHYVDTQRKQFERLGVLGDFDDPYLTLKPEFEAKQIEVFGKMATNGYIYKGLKPVYWCPECQTALAEAEIEYEEDPCFSIYVKFDVKDDKGKLAALGADLSKTYFVIWTTTTWTLPGNMAICVGPEYEYCLVKAKGEYYVMARELINATMKAAEISEYEILGSLQGKDLEYMVCKHPFMDRDSLVIVGDHVTLDSGTGCVHTAPGHGTEDFEVCVNHYPEIKIIVPVDSKGYLTEAAGKFAGLSTDEANKAIAADLTESGHMFAVEKIVHQYPHCWRCKHPIIYRATEQWFCSVENFKEDALKAIEDINWIPSWGEGRIKNMVSDRSDWCISRQRIWGVPIPIFYCEKCGEPHVDEASIQAVSQLFAKEGSDAWWNHEASEILPAGTTCKKCGSHSFRKESDIMDVWFDSGTSHAAVLSTRDDLKWPCDLYLEGADQYRGWFQSSLLTSVAWKGVAPYKNVCTHGWVVDAQGKTMHKSLGNGIAPEEVIKDFGADILRLWVASSDYHSDIRISNDILKQLSEVYRKIRNTARYILGNLYDFNPDTDSVSDDQLFELDRWALATMDKLAKECNEAYERFEFHSVYYAVRNFCTIDMSNFYLDILKDRLYVEAPNSVSRRAAQTTIYRILRDLTLVFAPILAFTCDEIWQHLPKSQDHNPEAPVLNEMPKGGASKETPAFMEKWEHIRKIRDDINKALEDARAAKTIGKSLEAKVTLTCTGDQMAFLKANEEILETVFIVSKVVLNDAVPAETTGEVEGLHVLVEKADGQKCERCWVYSETVGSDPEHPTLCARCSKILK
ncbi:MAG: isoleucine--tRNA ligase [Negativibacillus sp.]